MGLSNRITSVRAVSRNTRVDDRRYAPAPAPVIAPAAPQITFYEDEGMSGRSFTTGRQINNFNRFGFNDSASSAVVVGERWEVCEDARFRGQCVVLRQGTYPSLRAMGLNNRVSSVRVLDRNERIDERRYAPAFAAVTAPATGQITFYENEGLNGRSFSTAQEINNFNRFGFNDRASSVVVVGERWEVCDDVQFRGQCVVLRQGTYPSLRAMGLNDRVSSVRMLDRNERIDDRRYAPALIAAPVPGPDFRPQRDERLFEANVTSVRAVMGTPEQRCWVEPGQVAQGNNVPGAIAGALLGGILGHQVGGGSGKDLATVGGVIAGAALGAKVNGQQGAAEDVRRCENVPNQKPQYWDVTYNFRGQDHRVQMTTPPGQTVTVNAQGEPRK
ncbi:MAG: glycine zipper 2TM domain-containing protein [Gammaproteobacteria bacterium]|nr:glycine zipper 2TM domain-containing protein [Rhodoferax sp.]MBU3897809.1 glycine zipper 2TM domain-containing protein [Gammaproteobacteria bacterium]MBU3996952.1 glycine zipper 2TM domain-containing protein [Gammaproteobacteria bacterium]MBU4017884.1 glycine zipper 2TM domain-containing protein [Gammaproteobacteria bacterium]MBU4078661.1 glycine zipper 2TM domain-containing protein [Gammaproteobacteria bacterium]